MLATSSRRLALASLLCLVALLSWASWEAPVPLTQGPSEQVVRFRVGGVNSDAQARALEQQLGAVPGVTASSFAARTRVLTLQYRAADISEAELGRIVSVDGALPLEVLPVPETHTGAGQPAAQASLAQRLRYALNLRRLFY